MHIKEFAKQHESDEAIEDLATRLNISRRGLGIVASTGKGLVAGTSSNMTLTLRESRVITLEESTSDENYLKVTSISDNVEFILLVESEAIFKTLVLAVRARTL